MKWLEYRFWLICYTVQWWWYSLMGRCHACGNREGVYSGPKCYMDFLTPVSARVDTFVG